MTLDEFRQLLVSELPSDRLAAAKWAQANPLTPEHTDLLTQAVAAEPVTRIRALLNEALGPVPARAIRIERVPQPIQGSATTILDDLAGIIRHELTPPVGWIRSAANREIADFEASRTSAMIDRLFGRVLGLSSLATAYRRPRLRASSLNEVIAACIDNEDVPQSLVSVSYASPPNDTIMTDPDLLLLLMSNVVTNAVEACPEVSKPDQVLVAAGTDGGRFWVRVTNPTDGTGFSFKTYAASGRTTKKGHPGFGTRVIELVAGALGYEFDLTSEGGAATFVLEGPRGV